MKTWIVANQKGGVGKTTSVVTMAAMLARYGNRVLVLDLDPHGSLSAYFGYDTVVNSKSLYHLFYDEESGLSSIIIPTTYDNIHIVRASPALSTLDRQFGSQSGKGRVLSAALAKLRNTYDYVLVDCPPTLGILMINALAAGDWLIVPVQTEFLALKGTERMMLTLNMVNKARVTPLRYLIVPTMFDRRTKASKAALRNLQIRYGEALWDLVIPVDTQFRDASLVGQPLSYLQENARGALAYAALVNTLVNLNVNGEEYREDRLHESH